MSNRCPTLGRSSKCWELSLVPMQQLHRAISTQRETLSQREVKSSLTGQVFHPVSVEVEPKRIKTEGHLTRGQGEGLAPLVHPVITGLWGAHRPQVKSVVVRFSQGREVSGRDAHTSLRGSGSKTSSLGREGEETPGYPSLRPGGCRELAS